MTDKEIQTAINQLREQVSWAHNHGLTALAIAYQEGVTFLESLLR